MLPLVMNWCDSGIGFFSQLEKRKCNAIAAIVRKQRKFVELRKRRRGDQRDNRRDDSHRDTGLESVGFHCSKLHN
jgi:hypothetical protein